MFMKKWKKKNNMEDTDYENEEYMLEKEAEKIRMSKKTKKIKK